MNDPTVGRFITQDPSEFVGEDENLYRYCGNDPINATDPIGLYSTGMTNGIGQMPSSVSYFKIEWSGNIYLEGKLLLYPIPIAHAYRDSKSTRIKVLMSRPYMNEGYREMWNALGNEVPDSWDRKAWDPNNTWLWPHLYKHLNGSYGGYDPYKRVSDDYMGILARSYDIDYKEIGKMETSKWFRLNGTAEVSHNAQSQDLVLPLDGCIGRIKIWLAMLDTISNRPTRKYPKEGAGYAVAYFDAQWSKFGNDFRISVRQIEPPPPSYYTWPGTVPDDPPKMEDYDINGE
jgi:hypothetical protein